MTGFYKDLLQNDEQRSVKISQTAEEAATKPKVENKIKVEAEERSAAQITAELNARGADMTINDEGGVIDKRQLLSAGLNLIAKPKPNANSSGRAETQGPRALKYSRSAAAASARD